MGSNPFNRGGYIGVDPCYQTDPEIIAMEPEEGFDDPSDAVAVGLDVTYVDDDAAGEGEGAESAPADAVAAPQVPAAPPAPTTKKK